MDANQLLIALARATELYERDARYAGRWDGAFITFLNASGTKPGLLDDLRGQEVRTADIDDLVDRGLLRTEAFTGGAAVARKFRVTGAGRRLANELMLETSVDQGADSVDLSWPMLRKRLDVFVSQFEAAGAPRQGLQLSEGSAEASHLRALWDAGYLEETVYSVDQVTMLKPTERALTVVREWPSALSAATEVLDEVLRELADRPGPEARAARDGLASAGRELVTEVLASVIAKQSGLG